MPAPRVLDPLPELSYGEPGGNRVIEGDNLQVMISLRSHYQGTIDIAYLDPPYNTGRNDFAYSDSRYNDPNADADDMVYVGNEDGGRHTKWLNYMGPRLWLVWQLLADHGVCFVSISDVELFRLGLLMDEIFGEQNRLGVLVWKGSIENNATQIASEHEYVLCYAKRKERATRVWKGQSEAKEWLLATYRDLTKGRRRVNVASIEKEYRAAIRAHVEQRKQEIAENGESDLVDLGRAARYRHVDKRGVYAAEDHTDKPTGGYFYDVIHPVTEKPCKKPESGYRFTEETMDRLLAEDRIVFGKDHQRQVQVKKYLADVAEPLRSVLTTPAKLGTGSLRKLLGPPAVAQFPHPKPVELIEQLLWSTGYDDALVLDPFAGSGTTAHAVMRLNASDGGSRRFIMIEEGTRDDRYCRTLLAPRLSTAIEQEELPGGFTFEVKGRRLNRGAILDLEREAIANLIIHTDATGKGRGIARVGGEYVIGQNPRQEAICLCWNGRSNSTITRDILVAMFEETSERGLRRPIRAYGATCDVGETDSFRFCQIPDEILAALQIDEDDGALSGDPDAVELLETAALTADDGG